MKKIEATGIVAEFNPLHIGHEYFIKETKKQNNNAPIVAVMSGSTTQRGDIPIVGKFARTKMALLSGVDLVVELPTIFVTGGAESFAAGAVSIMKGMGLDTISFGSESGDAEKITAQAEIIANEPPEYKEELKKQLKEGQSFARARNLACKACINENSDDKEIKKLGSNDILAIEYVKQLFIQDTEIKPICIKRAGREHRDNVLNSQGVYASASAIRNATDLIIELDNPEISMFLPDTTKSVFEEIAPCVKPILNEIYTALRIKLLTAPESELESIMGAGEGITNKLRTELRYCDSFESFTQKVISKRYTEGRINRLCLNILLGLKKDEYSSLADAFLSGESRYARVLGFTAKGAEVLRQIKDNNEEDIKLITNIKKEIEKLDQKACRILEYDIIANDILNMTTMKNLYEYSDYVMKPIQV